jgi:hypothetical protein
MDYCSIHTSDWATPLTGTMYACSFILTNLDVAAPDKEIAAEHWYRHRTTVEHLPRRQARRRPGRGDLPVPA